MIGDLGNLGGVYGSVDGDYGEVGLRSGFGSLLGSRPVEDPFALLTEDAGLWGLWDFEAASTYTLDGSDGLSSWRARLSNIIGDPSVLEFTQTTPANRPIVSVDASTGKLSAAFTVDHLVGQADLLSGDGNGFFMRNKSTGFRIVELCSWEPAPTATRYYYDWSNYGRQALVSPSTNTVLQDAVGSGSTINHTLADVNDQTNLRLRVTTFMHNGVNGPRFYRNGAAVASGSLGTTPPVDNVDPTAFIIGGRNDAALRCSDMRLSLFALLEGKAGDGSVAAADQWAEDLTAALAEHYGAVII